MKIAVVTVKTWDHLEHIVQNDERVKNIIRFCKKNNIPLDFTHLEKRDEISAVFKPLSLFEVAVERNNIRFIKWLMRNNLVIINRWRSIFVDGSFATTYYILNHLPSSTKSVGGTISDEIMNRVFKPEICIKYQKLWHNKGAKGIPLIRLL